VARAALASCAAQLAAVDQSVERRALTLQTRAAPSRPCGSGSALVLALWQVAADWLQIGQQSVADSSKGAGGCIFGLCSTSALGIALADLGCTLLSWGTLAQAGGIVASSSVGSASGIVLINK